MAVGNLPTRAQLGKEIGKLAQEPGLRSRKAELEALSKALKATDTKDLAPWADLDLVQAYGRSESVREATRTPPETPYWRWLEAGLGALVFVPLLFTWLGLTRASAAYESLLEADSRQAGRPFLQLWQTGFEGHLSGWFTFGHVAGSATAAIVLLLGCAIAHGMRRVSVERAEEGARQSGEDLLARLVPLLVQAQLELNGLRSESPDRFTGELGKAASLLTHLAQQAVTVQESLEKTARTTGETVVAAEKRLKGADAAARPLAEAAGRIETALSSHTDSLTTALEEIHEAGNGIGEQLERGTARVEDVLGSINEAQRSFSTSTELASDLSGRTLARLGDVTEQSAQAVDASQEAFRQLAEQTAALRTVAERFAELEETVRARAVAVPPQSPQPPGVPPQGGNGGNGGNGAGGVSPAVLAEAAGTGNWATNWMRKLTSSSDRTPPSSSNGTPR